MHKKLRSKRLAPVLIKEVTRQCHLKGVFQAIYTAGVVIPTPISTCRYYHRTLNVPKLVDVKFTYVPRDMTIARMVRQAKVPLTPTLARSGLREMEERDVSAVGELYRRYMERFDMIPLLEEEDVRHQFLSGRGTGEIEASTGRRLGQVVWTYVVEVRSSVHLLLCPLVLNTTTLRAPRNTRDHGLHLILYATLHHRCPSETFASRGRLSLLLRVRHSLRRERGRSWTLETSTNGSRRGRNHFGRPSEVRRLQRTHVDGQPALLARAQGEVYIICISFLDDSRLATSLTVQFGSGDGLLNFYLYNWRSKGLAGMNATEDKTAGRGVGVVML